MHNRISAWEVLLHDAFATELLTLSPALQDELLAHARLLSISGPNLGRPTVATLKNARHPNMKEIRLN